MFFKNGNKYVGDFVDGEQHGRGNLTLTKSESYYGEFRSGVRTDHVVFLFKNGNKYEGELLNDNMTKNGTFYLKSDEIFDGDLDAKKNGFFG